MNSETRIFKQSIPLLAALLMCLGSAAHAQIPRINTFFPIGGKAGSTVEVEVRGSSLDGASLMLAHGRGVTGTVGGAASKADEVGRPIFQNRCGTCHELRSPANRSLTAAQWTATVERMIKVRQAPIAPADAEKITAFLVGQARNGRLTARIAIASDAMPSLYELRVVTGRGVSTAGIFEVGTLPEVIAVNNTRQTAPVVKLPCVANGCLVNNTERHFFRFNAKKGERLVFNLKGVRYSEPSVLFFNPDLRLYDSLGNEIVENHGYYDLDPLIDWTCPADGPYTIEVRDLLGRGNPGSVYRLTMGQVAYDTALYPPAAQAGVSAALHVIGKNTEGQQTTFTMPMPTETGLTTIGSPFGSLPVYVSPYPIVTDETKPDKPAALPAGFSGHIAKAGEAATFPIQGEGAFEFEAYNARLGAPGNMAVTLLNPQGQGMGRIGNDGRMTAKLESGKTYTLKVEETNGQGGPEYTYAIEARPAQARIECVMRPANVNLKPGMSAVVEVLLTRRDGTTGDIQVTAKDLPPGVTATTAAIQPDRQQTYLILTAAPNAKMAQATFNVIATAHGPVGDVIARAQPQEIYRLNNQPRELNRAESVVAVRGQSDFSISFDSKEAIKVHPRKYTEVKIRINRKEAFKGNVQARLEGLPLGWVCYQETAGSDKDELTLLIRPDGNNTQPFLNRDAKLTPIRAVLVGNIDEFEHAFGTILITKADRTDDVP